MRIVGPKSKLKHIERVTGVETADGTPFTWKTPVRFEGVMLALTGKERWEYQQFDVKAEYKIYTNYLPIVSEDKVTHDLYEYDVAFVDDKFLMGKIAVVLLHGSEE